MILIDNQNILKEVYPSTWRKIKDIEGSLDENLVQLEDTKQGNKTLCVTREGKKQYLHSKYDPIKEAEVIVDGYNNINDGTTVIFYGVGLGYHIDLFIKKYPNVNYYIFEPIPELLYKYLSLKSIKELSSYRLKDIVVGNDEDSIKTFINKFIDKSRNILHVCLNSHINIFPNEHTKFIELFKATALTKKSEIGADLRFQKRWIINSMKNFREILNTRNILLEKKGKFINKPAIIVAAGPSLNEEIENIRHIKEKGLAYIFSVGSAVNTLIHHNIYPDAACTYDPGKFNYNVFKRIINLNIKDIPMIFGSTVGYETLINYPGKKYHMITSQDTVSSYFLKNKDDNDIYIVYDAPTIAVVTMELLYELGFNPIILVGQNLGYRGREKYSKGISYSKPVSDKEIENSMKIKDVYGNEMLTNKGFNLMREQMEEYIKMIPDIEIINTTKGGAYIEGTKFVELKDVIENRLKEPVVDVNWLEGNKTNYDVEYLEFQMRKMNKAYDNALKVNKDYYMILNKIEKAIDNRNYSQAEVLYTKLDKELRRIENNDFYKVFILPMNRVQYKLLTNSIDSLNEIKDPREKGLKIIDKFRNFMDICIKEIENIKSVYEELVETIDKFCNMKKRDNNAR